MCILCLEYTPLLFHGLIIVVQAASKWHHHCKMAAHISKGCCVNFVFTLPEAVKLDWSQCSLPALRIFSWIKTQRAGAVFGVFGVIGGFIHRQMFFFFHSRPIRSLFFFFVSEMDVEEMRGKGCTSIYPAIHFIPLRGLDYIGETKVIRIHVIPKIQQKKKKERKNLSKQPSHPFRRAADGCLFTKKSAGELPTLLTDKLFNTSLKQPLQGAGDPGQLVINGVFIDDGQQCKKQCSVCP